MCYDKISIIPLRIESLENEKRSIMKVKPLKNESRPIQPSRWLQPPGTFPYRVQIGDTWIIVAQKFNIKQGPRYLIFVNFNVDIIHHKTDGHLTTDEVNWYLREYVGCRVSKDGGRNWSFDNADPGIIYIPRNIKDFDGEGEVIIGAKGTGGVVTVPQYDDKNFYDIISEALDIYGIVDMGVGVSGVALPLLIEGGIIFVGAGVSVAATFVALGAGDAGNLKYISRKHFFEGFSVGLVMSADGWSKDYINARHELKYAPLEGGYQEKGETFRKLHNYGLALGIMQGKRFNSVDIKNFFTYLKSRLTEAERQEYRGLVSQWPDRKRKDYYDRLSSMVKQTILDNNLQLKIK
jgi:hypothetical protein